MPHPSSNDAPNQPCHTQNLLAAPKVVMDSWMRNQPSGSASASVHRRCHPKTWQMPYSPHHQEPVFRNGWVTQPVGQAHLNPFIRTSMSPPTNPPISLVQSGVLRQVDMDRSWNKQNQSSKPPNKGEFQPFGFHGRSSLYGNTNMLHLGNETGIPGFMASSWQARQMDCQQNSANCEQNVVTRYLDHYDPTIGKRSWKYPVSVHLPSGKNIEPSMMESMDSSAPYPPVRTTSRVFKAYHTLECRKHFEHEKMETRPRPFSMPQSLTATNELYTSLADTIDTEDSATQKTINEGFGRVSPRELTSKQQPDPSVSEESLWWYHPLRRRRKRRSANAQPITTYGAYNRQQDMSKFLALNRATEDELSTTNYACPITCDCDLDVPFANEIHPHIPSTSIPPTGEQSQSMQPNLSTNASVSDVGWDKDMLALSHDRLVAFFAGMRETDA